MERTWEIQTPEGRRTVTLAQYRAKIEAGKAANKPIMDAWKRGDIVACERAQSALRA